MAQQRCKGARGLVSLEGELWAERAVLSVGVIALLWALGLGWRAAGVRQGVAQRVAV